MILFEYPLHERIRTYLRLEHLFARLLTLVERDHALDHHYALDAIFEIMDVCARSDLKTEVLKDLGRQKMVLNAYKGNPAIAEDVLDAAIGQVDQSFEELSHSTGRSGQALQEDDWLMAVRARASIPGGTCSFDLPAYYAWQQLPAEMRRQHITQWMQSLLPMHRAVLVLLNLLRDSGAPQKMLATHGMFQQHLPQGKAFLLLRLSVDESLGIVPEISANRLLVSIRFVQSSLHARGVAALSDVAFELTLSA